MEKHISELATKWLYRQFTIGFYLDDMWYGGDVLFQCGMVVMSCFQCGMKCGMVVMRPGNAAPKSPTPPRGSSPASKTSRAPRSRGSSPGDPYKPPLRRSRGNSPAERTNGASTLPQSRGSEESGKTIWNKPPSVHPTKIRTSSSPAIGSLVYCESSALDHVAIEAVNAHSKKEEPAATIKSISRLSSSCPVRGKIGGDRSSTGKRFESSEYSDESFVRARSVRPK
uniref:Uncharacterized protein n=1 Tax=Timema monikensis TaxID=170555 RepID=A0A7R9E6L2_9NEOP|nr:unnamed protein product [Timema monikensis]